MAKEEGVTTEELESVQAIVMAVAAGQVRAQFREARKSAAARRKPPKQDDPRAGEGP